MREQNAVIDGSLDEPLSGRQAFWLTGAGLSLIAVCYGLARFAYGLFVPVFRTEFALDSGTVGAIASGSYLSYCIAIAVSTVLTPRFGGRVIAAAAGVIAAIGVLMVAAAPTAWMLAAGVLIAGSSTGVASPPLAHAIAHTIRAPKRNRTQTVVNAGTGIGVAVASPIALLTHDHWRVAWAVFAMVCVLVTVWVVIAVPAGSVRRSGAGAVEALIPRPLLPAGAGPLILAAALMGASSSAVWTFGRDVLSNSGAVSQAGSSIAWVLLGAFGVLGAAAGDLIRRFGIRASWTATMFALGAATILLALCPGTLAVACVASAVFGAAYIALTGLLLVWGTEIYAEAPAAGVGLAFLVIALGQAAGAPVIGMFSQAASALTAFFVAGVVAVLGAFISPSNRGYE